MTRKDFILLAECLGNFKHYLLNDDLDIEEDFQGLIDNIKITCMRSNVAFKGDLFDQELDKHFQAHLKNN